MSSRAWPSREAVARMRRLRVGASRVAARARFALQLHAHRPLRTLREDQVERYACLLATHADEVRAAAGTWTMGATTRGRRPRTSPRRR